MLIHLQATAPVSDPTYLISQVGIPTDQPGLPDVLESLTNDSFQAVVHAMEGFLVNRQEVVCVEPDPAFFLKLSRVSGDQGSVAFFEAFGRTFENAWPVYLERQTDYGGFSHTESHTGASVRTIDTEDILNMPAVAAGCLRSL